MAADNNHGRDYWLARFSKTDLPAIGSVVNKLDAVTRKDTSSALHLADVILKDPSLTAQVLKIANTVFYNPVINNPITTISRAVVQLGIAEIKSIYASVALIDQLLKKQSHQNLLLRIDHAIHAAVQARNLMEHVSGKVNEEVFIAALLFQLGEMSFWSIGGEQADQLGDMIEQEDKSPEALTERLLGTSFQELTSGLAERWELGSVLKEALKNPTTDKTDVAAVQLSDRLAEAIQTRADSSEYETLLAEVAEVAEVAEFCDIDLKEAQALVERGTREAAAELRAYGVEQQHLNSKPTKKKSPALRPDPQLQLNMLRDLDTLVTEKCDINTLLHTVVEGIHLGVGLERVAIALCDAKRSKVQAKYVQGEYTSRWREQLLFPITQEHSGALMLCASKRQPINIGTGPKAVPFNAQEQELFGNIPALAAPILANDRLLGVFYADRAGKEPLEDEQRSAFQHIVRQANMSLEQLIRNRSR